MVFFMIVDCHKRSERDKDEKLCRVPEIILNQGEDVEERTRERMDLSHKSLIISEQLLLVFRC